ncbi:HAUS augmin-like complex subunit 3 [Eleutherodactylus coqui]|uniref:HAUS augmin-like complex subunit 3 N-terminal domain-containing protein n=1 Tax=Eleutherodactylus coqui TaxID=57060 RepID=A0A8J6EK69_ELECQ|nr:hypothetical protein GDO78_017192 [Eleutherodactylus coqui]
MAKQPVPPPSKGLSRQRSTCFLLESQRVQGSDFVELLRQIDYPSAKDLKGEDFDWLCEGNEEQEFLGWLCEMVDQRNVLSDEQLEAYNALLESGQPILEADELENLCKVCDKGDHELETVELRSIDELEAEVQSLQALKAHRIQSRNKLESFGLTLLHNRLALEKYEKEMEKSFNDKEEELLTLNSKCNSTLQRLGDLITELGQYHSTQSVGKIFLSSLDLDRYTSLEDACWEQVEENGKKMLPVNEEDVEKQRKAQEEMERESERIRRAWASQRMQLSIACGTLNGNKEALAWLNRLFSEQVWDSPPLRITEREVQCLEMEVNTLQKLRLPVLVCEASIGVSLPVHLGWAQAEKHRLSQLVQNQIPVTEAVLGQFSRLQMVKMCLQGEMQIHQFVDQSFQRLKVAIGCQSSDLGRRIFRQRDLRFSSQRLIPLRVDSKDHTAVRLFAMLEKPSKKKELFPKYDVLQHLAISLVQEIKSLSGICHVPLPQTVGLEYDCEALRQSLCRGTPTIQLRDPNLARALEALLASSSKFAVWFLEFYRDLERKKLSSQTSYVELARRLYVLFFQDPSLMIRAVEDLEQRVKDPS